MAAEAEVTLAAPKEKKEDPMKKPLHFKYYTNDGESDQVVDSTADDIPSQASQEVSKK